MIKKAWQGLLVLALVTLFTIPVSAKLLSQTAPSPFSVKAVESVGMTVADMERAIAFYTEVLGCQKLSDVEVWGNTYENLQGLFGLRMRLVRLALGDETIELTDYLTPGGRPIPVEQRSNDLSFQHIAIVVSDMSRAYRLGVSMQSDKCRSHLQPKTIPSSSNLSRIWANSPHYRDGRSRGGCGG